MAAWVRSSGAATQVGQSVGFLGSRALSRGNLARRSMLPGAKASVLRSTCPEIAQAQQAADEGATAGAIEGLDEIVVTAHRPAENLLDVPVAVRASDIAATCVRSITELADFTPGPTFQGQGAGGVADRSATCLVFRGLSTSFGTIFINGALYTGNNSPDVTNLERVEVASLVRQP